MAFFVQVIRQDTIAYRPYYSLYLTLASSPDYFLLSTRYLPMASIISAKELRQHFGEIADRVEKGEEFVVLKRSKPLFRMVPISKDERDRGVC